MLKGAKTEINSLDSSWLLTYQITGKDELTSLLLDMGSHNIFL